MKTTRTQTTLSLAALTVALAACPALAQDGDQISKDTIKGAGKHYSPYVGRDIPDRVLWGDTHLHTSFSPDAGLTGTTLGPEEGADMLRAGDPALLADPTGKRWYDQFRQDGQAAMDATLEAVGDIATSASATSASGTPKHSAAPGNARTAA